MDFKHFWQILAIKTGSSILDGANFSVHGLSALRRLAAAHSYAPFGRFGTK